MKSKDINQLKLNFMEHTITEKLRNKISKKTQKIHEASNSEWKPLVNYENQYLISDKAQIKSLAKKRIMKTHTRKDGVIMIGLSKDLYKKVYVVNDLFPLFYKTGEEAENYLNNLPCKTYIYNKKIKTEEDENSSNDSPIEQLNNMWKTLDESPNYEISALGELRNRKSGNLIQRTPHGKFQITLNTGKRNLLHPNLLIDKYFHNKTSSSTPEEIQNITYKVVEEIPSFINEINRIENLIIELENERDTMISMLGNSFVISHVHLYNRLIDKLNLLK